MSKTVTINQDKLLMLKEALDEFMVDKNSNFISRNSIWFIIYRGDLLFFDYNNRALLDDFFYRHQNELGEFTYDYQAKKWITDSDFDSFVRHLGNSIPYLITGWICDQREVYINKNQNYDILNSNELYQLVKKLPRCRFYINGEQIINNKIIDNKGKNVPDEWYHGTRCIDAINILRRGLRPSPENSPFTIKHDKTVFITTDFYQASWYADYKRHNVNNGHWWSDKNSYPCVLKIDGNKIDQNKIVYDYDVYNGHSVNKNDNIYNDRMKELGITYDNKSLVIQKSTDPRKYKKVGYRGIIMPSAIKSIILVKYGDVYEELSVEDFLNRMRETNVMKEGIDVKLTEAAPEVDEYEIGDEGSNPLVGGNFYHVNEAYNVSVRGDLDSINTIEFIPHENAREEGYEDDEIEDFEPYYEVEAMDMDGNTILYADLTVEELFDYFPQSIINDIIERDKSNATRLSNPSINQYRIEDILYRDTTPSDVDNVDEVNRIAKKIQTGGPSAYLLTDGDIIYFHDHIYINNIDGITPDKFIALGNIRLGNGGFELIKEPTRQQMYELKQWIRQQDGGIYVDFCEESHQTYPRTLFSTRYGSPNAERIVNDIYYYFEEGIKPQDNFYESKDKEKVLENFDFEVDSSEIDLSSFKKKHELVPNIWNPDGKLNSRIRLKLLDIADDFWEYVNLTWVKPSGIILTGSICNFNWSQYSDIDLHLIVDFDEIDEKIEFVKDYLDSKKNEWNNEHSGLQIMGYPVELYVQNLGEMPESNGIYDLEENDWVREPNPDDIKSIGLNKFSIKEKAAKIMTIIDDMYDVLASTDDSHKIEQMGDDASYLWKKVKEMRKSSLEKNGESGSGNIVYKILRRTGYLDRLFKLSNVVYDKFNSITESVESSIIKEYLDKDYSLPLYKYFKWAETASDKEKVENVFYNCPNFIEYYLEEINGNYEILDEFLEKVYQNASIINDKNFINQLVNAIDELGLSENALEYLESTIDPEEQPSWMIMSLIEIVKNRWCIHFTNNANDAYNIAKNGFTKGVKNINFLAYTINREKNSPGYDFAFLLDDNELNFNSFGNGAVIFRTNGVLTYHEEDASAQVVFWGPNVKEMIPIEKDQNSASWMIKGANGKVLKSGTPSELAAWVDNNFVQYRNQIATKSLYYNESIKKYITLLKENLINEEVVADGNSEHNPYKKRWEAERKALKDFICNFGKVMTSKENGKTYKVYYDKTLSQLIGYNYCICLQWDAVNLKPKSVLYIRALDKFTDKMFQANFDARGRDNMAGTYDDINTY